MYDKYLINYNLWIIPTFFRQTPNIKLMDFPAESPDLFVHAGGQRPSLPEQNRCYLGRLHEMPVDLLHLSEFANLNSSNNNANSFIWNKKR